MWPITLAFARGDHEISGPYSYRIEVRWLAINPHGGIPKEQKIQKQTGCQYVFVSDRDLPQNLKARVNKPEANIQHLVICGVKAPIGEGGKSQCFRLLVKVEGTDSNKVYFNTCVKYGPRVTDHVTLMDGDHPSVTPGSTPYEVGGQNMRK